MSPLHGKPVLWGRLLGISIGNGFGALKGSRALVLACHLALLNRGTHSCATLRYPAALICLSFSILCREIMQSIRQVMRRDQPRTPEAMRSTLPNTDQPRISHSEYHHRKAKSIAAFKKTAAGVCMLEKALALLVVHRVDGICWNVLLPAD